MDCGVCLEDSDQTDLSTLEDLEAYVLMVNAPVQQRKQQFRE